MTFSKSINILFLLLLNLTCKPTQNTLKNPQSQSSQQEFTLQKLSIKIVVECILKNLLSIEVLYFLRLKPFDLF